MLAFGPGAGAGGLRGMTEGSRRWEIMISPVMAAPPNNVHGGPAAETELAGRGITGID